MKKAIVTGATGKIGFAVARQIADKENYCVTLVARNEEKAKKAVDEIIASTGNENVDFMIADLSSFKAIQALRKLWDGPLHCLINNAAITPRKRMLTNEGLELQWATNVLGYFWMIKEFTDVLKQTENSRVVNVASYWAGGLDLSDPEFKNRNYDNDSAYRQSKQANRMITSAFDKEFKSNGISINACHPGDVNSKLSNDLGFGGSQSPDEGAETPVWLATETIGIEMNGKYFEHKKQVECQFMQDRDLVSELYRICGSY